MNPSKTSASNEPISGLTSGCVPSGHFADILFFLTLSRQNIQKLPTNSLECGWVPNSSHFTSYCFCIQKPVA